MKETASPDAQPSRAPDRKSARYRSSAFGCVSGECIAVTVSRRAGTISEPPVHPWSASKFIPGLEQSLTLRRKGARNRYRKLEKEGRGSLATRSLIGQINGPTDAPRLSSKQGDDATRGVATTLSATLRRSLVTNAPRCHLHPALECSRKQGRCPERAPRADRNGLREVSLRARPRRHAARVKTQKRTKAARVSSAPTKRSRTDRQRRAP